MSEHLSISTGQCSKAGVKESNEDSLGLLIPKSGLLRTKGIAAIVADGVSSSAAGREASESCVQGFLSDYYSTPESWTTKTSVRKVLGALNRWLYGQGIRRYDSHMGLVTTLSLLILKSATAHIFHVGDTRIYRKRGSELECLTNDHRIISSGSKTFLARAMGVEPHVDFDYYSTSIELGDQFILITDGGYEFINNRNIVDLINTSADNLNKAAENIVNTALNNNSDDNISCVIVQIDAIPYFDDEESFYKRLTELPFPPPLEAGQTIDHYRIIRELHSSKRTEVYLAHDIQQVDRKVVLKAPSINFNDDPYYIDRFLHEEWVGRRLNNTNVLKVLDHPRDRQFLYYTVEYVEGQTLRQWMQDNPQPTLNDVREFINQAVRGLHAFHRLEMVHQDIKPENIIIDKNNTVKIIDFGSTKIAGIEEIQTPLKENNDVLGTVNYTAPEIIISGMQGSVQSDLYSIATIAYEMLTGRLPYGAELSAQQLRRAEYVSASSIDNEIPLWVDEALRKALQQNPTLRYIELSEFIYDLSNPNPKFLEKKHEPLIERDPINFWRGLAYLSLLLNVVLMYLLFK